jgi:hypothetical protein
VLQLVGLVELDPPYVYVLRSCKLP